MRYDYCLLVQVGVIQTAYANGASTEYIQSTLGLAVECTPTGRPKGRGDRVMAEI